MAAILVLLGAAVIGLRCVDAAHTGARMSAIGEPRIEIEKLAKTVVGADAAVAIHHDGHWATVTVTAPVSAGPWVWQISHTAHAYLEPGL